jgi:hypothetical protein
MALPPVFRVADPRRRCAVLVGIVAAGLAVTGCGADAKSKADSAACSAGRGLVSNLSDNPRLLPTRNTTLLQLSRLPTPARLPRRRLTDERRVYRVTGQVIDVRTTRVGLRVVVGDGAGHTLITRVPSAQCAEGTRQTTRRKMDTTRSRVQLCSDATLTGVLFHSGLHEGSSGLRNGVELAPLLSFTCLAPKVPFGH